MGYLGNSLSNTLYGWSAVCDCDISWSYSLRNDLNVFFASVLVAFLGHIHLVILFLVVLHYMFVTFLDHIHFVILCMVCLQV